MPMSEPEPEPEPEHPREDEFLWVECGAPPIGASASARVDGDLSFDGGRRSRRAGAAAVQFLQRRS